MIIDFKKITLVVMLVTAVFLPFTYAAEDVAGLLNKMPAMNADMEGELCSKILIGGDDQLKQICSMKVRQ